MAADGRLPRKLKSYEMDEHLKTLYPYAKTPQERMRECNINLMKMHNDMSWPGNDAPLAVEDDIFANLFDFSTYSEPQDGSSQYGNTMGSFETLHPTASPSHYLAPAALGVDDIYAANYSSLHADSGLDSSSSSMGSFENSPHNYTSLCYSAPPEFQTPYMDNPLSVGSSSPRLSPATINSQSSPERQPSPILRRQVSTDADIEPAAAPLVMVLSVKDMATVAQRTRAKYSAQKRKEVHETRKRGACEKCRRRKKKCVHVALMDRVELSERPTAASKPARRLRPSNDGGTTLGHPSRPMSSQRTANTASATPQVHQVPKGGYDYSPTNGTRGPHVGIVEPDTSPEASLSPFPPESDFVLFPEEMDLTLPPLPTNMDLMWIDLRYIYSSTGLFDHVEAIPTQDGLNRRVRPGTSGVGKTAMTSIATGYPQTPPFEHTRQAPHFTASWKEFDEAIESLLTGSPCAVVEPNGYQHSQCSRYGPNISSYDFDKDVHSHPAPAESEGALGAPDKFRECTRDEPDANLERTPLPDYFFFSFREQPHDNTRHRSYQEDLDSQAPRLSGTPRAYPKGTKRPASFPIGAESVENCDMARAISTLQQKETVKNRRPLRSGGAPWGMAIHSLHHSPAGGAQAQPAGQPGGRPGGIAQRVLHRNRNDCTSTNLGELHGHHDRHGCPFTRDLARHVDPRFAFNDNAAHPDNSVKHYPLWIDPDGTGVFPEANGSIRRHRLKPVALLRNVVRGSHLVNVLFGLVVLGVAVAIASFALSGRLNATARKVCPLPLTLKYTNAAADTLTTVGPVHNNPQPYGSADIPRCLQPTHVPHRPTKAFPCAGEIRIPPSLLG